MKTEQQIQAEILINIGKDFHDSVRAWRVNTGAFKVGGRFVRFGFPGMADISGILINGRRLEIEVKTAKGKQSQPQKNFEKMIKKHNGIYLLAREYDTVKKALNIALTEAEH